MWIVLVELLNIQDLIVAELKNLQSFCLRIGSDVIFYLKEFNGIKLNNNYCYL